LGKHVLITGGAGFIGSHLADEVLDSGHVVRIVDNLSAQVHGQEAKRPEYLTRDAELIVGDIRDPEITRRALKGVDAVFHFAASVGVGQSMYEIASYTSVNNVGTAVLLEQIVERPVERLIVASSMSIYGEGMYLSPDGKLHAGLERTPAQLKAGDWELRNGGGEVLSPAPTPESKLPCLASIYALSKYDQERMCLMIGNAYGIPTVALRFFNVYGPRQSLSNPYTGVLAIFASRYLNGNPPLIFEDGRQRRDFVSIHDVVEMCMLSLTRAEAPGHVFNVGSGRPYAVLEIAERLAAVLNKKSMRPQITGKYRMGDIRHCFADISRARTLLGYKPRVTLEEGLQELAGWLEGRIALDRVAEASAELHSRGLGGITGS
jgi:dTDP-L-rhamnose 4-epimerase